MLDATIKRYTTRQAAGAVSAVLALTILLLAGQLAARPGDGGERAGRAHGGQISGSARVVDGDTLVVGERRVRLEGIDAPESSQTCSRADGRAWPCGDAATRTLAALIGSRSVQCDDAGTDRYGRVLGLCRAGGTDLNREMVRLGLAWAFVRYSRRYAEEETGARAARRGIWQGESQPAWDYRAGQWQAAVPDAPGGCAIKGNVSGAGRIYHLPWDPWYGKVRMEGGHRKRWFCTEAEAVAAGWRRAIAH